MTEQKTSIHYNPKQLLFHVVRAALSVLIWGRGTGKTYGPHSNFHARNVTDMPRGNGLLITTSYEKILTMVLPQIVSGWEAMGYRENIHFTIGRWPEKAVEPEQYAYVRPLSAKHYITWFNGAGIYLGSMDRPSTMNGISVDWLSADEVRFFDHERFMNVLFGVRGNSHYFGHLSAHGSMLFTTDMPRSRSSAWLFDYAKDMDEELIDMIVKLQLRTYEIQAALAEATSEQIVVNGKELSTAHAEQLVLRYTAELNELRKDTTYYSEASTLDNIHVIGLDRIRGMKAVMNDYEFRTGVLNHRTSLAAVRFYSTFDEQLHVYDAANYGYIDGLEIETKAPVKDCRWDRDLDLNAPLEIGCDYNIQIMWATVSQPGDWRVMNEIYVEHPKKLSHLAEEIDRYYKPKKANNKVIILYYDHTATKRNSVSDVTEKKELTRALTKLGWEVRPIYLHQLPTHDRRYHQFQKHFRPPGSSDDIPALSIARRCTYLIGALENTGTILTSGQYKKDKRDEKNESIDQRTTTHSTEAMDCLITGKLKRRTKESDYVMPSGTA